MKGSLVKSTACRYSTLSIMAQRYEARSATLCATWNIDSHPNEKLHHISRTSLEKVQLASSPATPKGLRPLQVQSFQKRAPWCSFRGPAKRCDTGLSTLVYFERSNPSHYCLWKRTLTIGGTPRAVDNTTPIPIVFLHILIAETAMSETMLRHSSASTAVLKCSSL